MGQQCCAASENTPEIIITTEQAEQKDRRNSLDRVKQEQKMKESREKSQKNQFYGKDGHVHSKTITKQMTNCIDRDIDQYKNMIFTNQPSIPELPEEQDMVSKKHILEQPEKREDRIKRQKDVVQQFLGDMTQDISSAIKIK